MLPIGLLALLGFGLTAFAIDEWWLDDDDDNDDTGDEVQVAPEDPDDTEEAGPDPTDPRVYLGTDGDDTLTEEEADALPGEINLFEMGDGNDRVDLGPDVGNTLNGGEGNDTLSVENEENLVDGGPGDDVLSAGLGSTIMGGEGDDMIAFDQQDSVLDGQGEVQGGAGNDTISISTDIGFNVSANGPVAVSGNEGADTFEVEIDQVDNDDFYDPRDRVEDPTFISIEDFTPGEDVLTVDVAPLIETSGRDVTETELTELPGGGYELALTFSTPEGLEPLSTTIAINGPSQITLDDIVIIAPTAGLGASGDPVIRVT
ncbi:hypothetical protein OO012_12970 [Rhodobacteraceae bacterium KMM 6894]|nr:hypothetical protein [Rhodobacteraceae bacterium KMM 6894]